jgi:hypothetical protein
MTAYALTNIVLVSIWLALVFGILREYRKLAPAEATKDAA